jgi:hypothetical protein
MNIDDILVQDSESKSTAINGSVVVLGIAAGAYFRFNEIGSEIWTMFETPRRVGDVLASLARAYDVELSVISNDALPFLRDLVAQRLLHASGAGTGR